MPITKSDYLLFKQCPKSFWFQKNQKEHMSNLDQDDQDDQMLKRAEVRSTAEKLYEDGVSVPHDVNMHEMIQNTKRLIAEGTTTIFDAAFEFSGLFVICDIIRKSNDSWQLFDVKRSTGIKERHLDEAVFQFYVIANNLPVRSVSIMHINSHYVRKRELDVRELFATQDVSEEVVERLPILLNHLQLMNETVTGEMPLCDIGTHCNKYGKEDFECAAKGHCWQHVPNYSVFDVARIGKKAFSLYDDGILNIEDIPDEFKLSENQRHQVDAAKFNIETINKEKIREHLDTFKMPLYFVDFETFQQAIPLFDNLKPYQQIPFQYSLHIVKGATMPYIHKEFLGKEGEDPRRLFAENLIAVIPKNVTSIAYNMSFEKKVLKDLSELFPDLADHLMNIFENMVDLMIPFQQKWYFTNVMKGKYSIKNVYPALVPIDETLNYSNLAIQNGSMAMNTYAQLHTMSKHDIKRVRDDLLAYCHLDTLAMVKIWEVLNSL